MQKRIDLPILVWLLYVVMSQEWHFSLTLYL